MLLLLSLVVIIANLYFLSATRQHALSYSEQQNQATWFLFQLSKEFSELNSIIPFAANNEDYYRKAQLKYELTWSRFDLMLNSKEADTYIALPGARIFFSTLFNQFKALEPRLELLSHPDYTEQVTQEFGVLYMSMIQYVNTNFRIKSPLYRDQMKQAQNLNDIQFASLMLLVLCVCLAMYIFHQESEYHKQLSLTDSLTGIANRFAMFNELQHKIELKQPFQVFLLDLNGFKSVNDQFGHKAGDMVLQAFAQRISSLEKKCFRIGGDEFAVISDGLDADAIKNISQSIRQKMEESVAINDGHMIKISASVGCACFPYDSREINELLLIADTTMYSEKHANRQDIAS